MRIIEHMAKKGQTREIPLIPPKNFTVHEQVGDGPIEHIGWVITVYQKDPGVTPKGKEKKPKRFDILFSPDEAKDWHESLGKMLARFSKPTLDIADETTEEEDDEEDED